MRKYFPKNIQRAFENNFSLNRERRRFIYLLTFQF